MTNNATTVPYLLHFGAVRAPGKMLDGDVITAEDTLPAVSEIDSEGFAITRATRVTDVKQETLDDN